MKKLRIPELGFPSISSVWILIGLIVGMFSFVSNYLIGLLGISYSVGIPLWLRVFGVEFPSLFWSYIISGILTVVIGYLIANRIVPLKKIRSTPVIIWMVLAISFGIGLLILNIGNLISGTARLGWLALTLVWSSSIHTVAIMGILGFFQGRDVSLENE